MHKQHKLAFLFSTLVLAVLVLGGVLLAGNDIPVLQPKGTIAADQRNLIIFTTLLGMIVILPVFFLTFYIAWKYNAKNATSHTKYAPDMDGNRRLEIIWWLIPLAIITILSVVTWKTSHSLDPYKPLASDNKPVTVEVIALEWKWLFIYPEYGIATVNYVQFPEDTPVNFKITGDAPMNSFWIPALGGMVYAMSGMETKLHLMADNPGIYTGSSSNISGEGFAGMKFNAESTKQRDFNQWVETVQKSSKKLDLPAYNKLAQKSRNNPPAYYQLAQPELFNTVMMKYMAPPTPESGTTNKGHGSGH